MVKMNYTDPCGGLNASTYFLKSSTIAGKASPVISSGVSNFLYQYQVISNTWMWGTKFAFTEIPNKGNYMRGSLCNCQYLLSQVLDHCREGIS